jgi:hypothetical protein
MLMEMALLIDGISRLIHGFGDKESRGWSRGFRIGVGIQMAVDVADGTQLHLTAIPRKTDQEKQSTGNSSVMMIGKSDLNV